MKQVKEPNFIVRRPLEYIPESDKAFIELAEKYYASAADVERHTGEPAVAIARSVRRNLTDPRRLATPEEIERGYYEYFDQAGWDRWDERERARLRKEAKS